MVRRRERGSEYKIPIVVAVQTPESSEAQFSCLAQMPFTRSAILAFAQRMLIRSRTVISDGLDRITATPAASVHTRSSLVVAWSAPSCRKSRPPTP